MKKLSFGLAEMEISLNTLSNSMNCSVFWYFFKIKIKPTIIHNLTLPLPTRFYIF